MRVPDALVKCVAFVQYKDAHTGEFHFGGTVFFVSIPIPAFPGEAFMYAVTAHHVIHNIKKKSAEREADGNIYLRLNLHTSSTVLIATSLDRWLVHPDDPSVDVAVCPFVLDTDWDHMTYPVGCFVDEACIDRNGIGMGDEIFLMGLFVHHRATKQNSPIMRVGNIAAMPNEPIRTYGPCFDEMEAYLVETRSIAGLSGSPVFVNLETQRNIGQGSVITLSGGGYGMFYLLGLIHGHWGQKTPDTDPTTKDVRLHTGISIVVPARKILEVLHHPELVDMRAKEELMSREEHAAIIDDLYVIPEEK